MVAVETSTRFVLCQSNSMFRVAVKLEKLLRHESCRLATLARMGHCVLVMSRDVLNHLARIKKYHSAVVTIKGGGRSRRMEFLAVVAKMATISKEHFAIRTGQPGVLLVARHVRLETFNTFVNGTAYVTFITGTLCSRH